MREYLPFVFVLFILTACTDHHSVHKFLDAAEYYMEAYPDTAYTILENIPNPELLTGKNQARYALLMTQAMDKNYIKMPSDSLIFLALSYYKEDKKDVVSKAKAYFYYGVYLNELGAYEDAQKNLHETILLLENTKEYKLLGMTHEEIGNINMTLDLYDSALINFKKSFEKFNSLKDSIALCHSYRNIGIAYSRKGNIDSTLHYYNNALKIAVIQNSKYESLILQNISSLYRSIGEYDKAELYINEAIEKGCHNSHSCNLSLGYIHLARKEYKEAEFLLKNCLESPYIHTLSDAYKGLYELEKDKQNFKQALIYKELSDSLLLASNKDIDNTRQKITNLSRSFLQTRYEEKDLKTRNKFMGIAIMLISIAFILTLGALFLCLRLRSRNMLIKEIESKIAANSKEIAQHQGLLHYYEKQHNVLKNSNVKEINELTNRINILTEQNNNLKLRIKSQDKFDGLIETPEVNQYVSGLLHLLNISNKAGYKTEHDDEEDFLALCNHLFRGFIERLKAHTEQKLTKHDLELACFIKLGLSNEEIGNIFNTQASSVSKAKSRLKTRLRLVNEENLDSFIKLF